jgi:hypothetical protein
MAIQVIDNFDINTSKPLDNRFVVGTSSTGAFYNTRHDIQWKYAGLRIWDLNDNQPYVYNGFTWSAEASSTIQGLGTAGYISKFTLSNQIDISEIYEESGNIYIGSTISFPFSPAGKLQVNGNIRSYNGGFYGVGSNITAINASNITLGSLDLPRISLSTSSPDWILSRNASSAIWINPVTSLSVGTASALAVTRNFWGQPFNGTQDVIGDMTINGQVNRVIRVGLLSGQINSSGTKIGRIEFGSGATINKTFTIPGYAGDVGGLDTFALLNTAATFSSAQTFTAITTMKNELVVNISNVQKLRVTSSYAVFGAETSIINTIFGPISIPINSPYIRTGLSTLPANPSYTWNSNTDLGIYRPSADVMGFVSTGVDKMRINSNGINLFGTSYTTVPLTFTDPDGAGGGSPYVITPVLSTDCTTLFWFGGSYWYLYFDIEQSPGSGANSQSISTGWLAIERKRSWPSDSSPSNWSSVIVPAGCRVRIYIPATGGATGYYRKFGMG